MTTPRRTVDPRELSAWNRMSETTFKLDGEVSALADIFQRCMPMSVTLALHQKRDPSTLAPPVQWLYSLYCCLAHYTGPEKMWRHIVQDRAQQKCVMFDILEVLRCPAAVPHGPDPPREMKGLEERDPMCPMMAQVTIPSTEPRQQVALSHRANPHS